jgi:hypothetical protein
MQELELNYPTTKGKVYSEEEDRYLLVRLNHYGMQVEDVYERIKRDISEFPVFRFDWFLKSRSPQELQRRCNTLLGMIEKEEEQRQSDEAKLKPSKGKVRAVLSMSPPTLIYCFRNEGSRRFRNLRSRSRDPPRLSKPGLPNGPLKRRKHRPTDPLCFHDRSLHLPKSLVHLRRLLAGTTGTYSHSPANETPLPIETVAVSQ